MLLVSIQIGASGGMRLRAAFNGEIIRDVINDDRDEETRLSQRPNRSILSSRPFIVSSN